jgi:superfamily II RNA helicase
MSIDIKQQYNYINVITGPCNILPINPAFTFTPKSDHFQTHTYNCIDNGDNVLVLAHTGCGKSRCAYYTIAKNLREGKNVIVTTPIKVLSNQFYQDMQKFLIEFEKQTGLTKTCGILTGDIKINPDADCIVMTAEILQNSLYKIGSEENKTRKKTELKENYLHNLGAVVIDEFHFLNSDRGTVYEETLCLLDPSVQLVMLSATLGNANEIANWLGELKKKITNIVSTKQRIIPLEHYIFIDNKLIHIMDNKNNFNNRVYDKGMIVYKQHKLNLKKNKYKNNLSVINEIIHYLKKKQMLQCIFFVLSRKNCEKYANFVSEVLVTKEEIMKIDKIFKKYMHKYEEKYLCLKQYQIIKRLLYKGLAYHHSGLLHILKEIIEILFKEGLIKVLFATETFAVGVNMPTKTVIFTELMKPTKNKRRYLLPSEFKQMAGRAGRRGKDHFGNVIILPIYDLPDRTDMNTIMSGKMLDITSKLKIDYSFVLKNIMSNTDITSSVNRFLEKSLYIKDTNKYIGTLKNDSVEINKKLNSFLNLSIKTNLLFEQYYNLHPDNINDNLNNFVIIKDRKKTKQFAQLKKKLHEIDNYEKEYNQYCDYRLVKQQYATIITEIGHGEKYSEKCSLPFINAMMDCGYINFIDKYENNYRDLTQSDVTIKGLLASQINECNPFMLTEILTNNLLDGLSPIEIAAFMSIFINDYRPDDRFFKSDVKGTKKIHDRIDKLQIIIKKFIDVENSYGIDLDSNDFDSNFDWTIYYDYIDAILGWGDGTMHTVEILRFLDIYEGNFVRNVLKINNIIKDVISLCKISRNIYNIPELDEIEPLIIKDLVTNESLYVNN